MELMQWPAIPVGQRTLCLLSDFLGADPASTTVLLKVARSKGFQAFWRWSVQNKHFCGIYELEKCHY